MYLRREATRESRTIFRYGNGTLSIQAPLAHLHCLQAVEVVAAAGCSAGTCNCRSTCFMQECHSCNMNRMIRTTSNARTTWDPELLTDFASASPCTTVANQKKCLCSVPAFSRPLLLHAHASIPHWHSVTILDHKTGMSTSSPRNRQQIVGGSTL